MLWPLGKEYPLASSTGSSSLERIYGRYSQKVSFRNCIKKRDTPTFRNRYIPFFLWIAQKKIQAANQIKIP